MKHVLLLIFLATFVSGIAQEMDITVKVSAPNLTIADPGIFKNLEREVNEMINNNQWTEEEYEDHEKISGQISITISKEISATSFEAEIAVLSARPVFNSSYTSQLVKYLDKNVTFSYDGLKPIQKSDNYVDNLSSILTFYVYYIIGMDYDSFSPYGGDAYFQKAFDIYASLPNTLQRGDDGWRADGNSQNNRYFLVENVRNPSLRGFRNAYYEYHRLALDKMHEDPNRARAVLTSSITQMGAAEDNYPRAILVRMFSDAKQAEITEIYKPAPAGEKKKVSTIMSKIDPQKATIYKNI